MFPQLWGIAVADKHPLSQLDPDEGAAPDVQTQRLKLIYLSVYCANILLGTVPLAPSR